MKIKNVEDLYPLSPTQEGMLFHTLYDPEAGVYVTQVTYTVDGRLDTSALNRAWQRVMSRHQILRTAFVGEGLKKNVQVVYRQVELPWEEQDWRGASPSEQQQRLEAFLRADRHRGFKLSEAPLMRFTIIRMADDVHQLVWSLHHLLLDGWSLSLVLKEVFAFYEAFRGGGDLEMGRPRPYRDYIVWLQRQDLSEAERFWRQTLKGFTAPTPFNVDHVDSISAGPERDYSEQQTRLSKQTTAALQSLARRQQLTLNTVVQGAWALLLSRYSGEKDVVFGSTVSGRPDTLPGAESMVGLFINTLPMRAELDPDESLPGWLKKLQQRQVEMRQYDYSPLVQVNGWSDVGRGLPLFESILAFENYPVDNSLREENAGLKIRNIRVVERPNYPLSVAAVPGPELQFTIVYDRHRFEDAAVARMLGHLQTLLVGIAANPEQRLSELPLLTDEERHQLLVEWNDTAADYPKDQCIHQLFEAQVERSPDATAVVCENRRLTYRELNERANQLAHHLRGRGVGPDVLVGVLTERSIEMVVGLLGVLKAGGAYVPLDSNYPEERLAFMLDDAQAPVLVTVESLARVASGDGIEVVCLDRDWNNIAHASTKNPVNHTVAKNLAYMIYTSGSTGKPKGVGIEHAGLINLVTWHQHTYSVTESDRATQLAGPAFDASVWELWPYLTAGASVYIPNEEIRVSPLKLLNWLETEAITISFVPTPLAQSILAESIPAGMALRTLLTGGDRLQQAPRQLLPFSLVNHYGPTENTVVATYAAIQSGAKNGSAPPIGRPISNVQIYILDTYLKPVPVGVAGEIYIGGDSLARGYHRRAELTAEKFIRNPFSEEPGARLYKTGDLARYLADGNIEFLGRMDHQVKIRGYRIELGEIEVVLSQHPAVGECAVIAREDDPGEKRLVAYVVAAPERTLAIGELRGHLKQKLPEYMVPQAFVLLEHMPLTANGKVDRRALPAPDQSRPELEESYSAPRTPTEARLVEIWAKVLGLKQVGIHDNFFELGGDSILSIQVITKANQDGLRLTPKQIFQHQTVAELATVVETAPSRRAEQGIVKGPVPLTPIQHWFFEQRLPEPHHFNQAMMLEAGEALDPVLLERAVQQLLTHHDALRLRFRQTAAGWQQANAGSDQAVPFSRLDLSALPETGQASAIEQTAARLQASLQLSEGPLVRAALFELGAGKASRLLIVIHHLAVDGVSWRILLEDLEKAYRQLSRGEAVGLAPKTTSFKLWAERLEEYAQSAELRRELPYWEGVLSRTVSRLPVDYAGGDHSAASARSVVVRLSLEETRALLQEVPAAYRTQINDVLLTALVQALKGWTGDGSALISLEGHGREDVLTDVDLSRTVGWFTSIFPVYLELEDEGDEGEALKAVKEQMRAIPNRGIGYGLLRYLSREKEIRERLQRGARAEVSFNYLGQFDQAFPESSMFRPGRESCGPFEGRGNDLRYPLDIVGSVLGGHFQATWTYSENVYRHKTVEGVAQRFLTALRALISSCRSPKPSTFTTSDFTGAKMSQADFDKLFSKIGKSIERHGK